MKLAFKKKLSSPRSEIMEKMEILKFILKVLDIQMFKMNLLTRTWK